ncbi:MAG: chemotaxis response regulator protein-glutamate methylesterase [Rhodospirillaceae bacterium]|nr:chemotaxis response regulator protein-glutamate methylesterase [Rhodospirillaceae bacterium]
MVVDDSAVIRGLTTRILEEDTSIQVVASVGNGQLAVNNLSRYDVDVIVLDIEMPVMDGLTALPKLLEVDPTVKIVMSSTLTSRNAEISLRALEAGATDYIPKPTSTSDISSGGDFRREMHDKVKALGVARRHQVGKTPGPQREKGPVRKAVPVAIKGAPISLRKPGLLKPKVLAIGSSTGGPQALFELLKNLQPTINVPAVITQHMPPTFTAILADHITRMTDWTCSEAKNGDELRTGHILLAPGDYHMLVENKAGKHVISINQGPQENFCRPAVDPMLRSLVEVFDGNIITVILTGMGADGLKGSEIVVKAGGTVVAQDEQSSVVWGMPGAVATAGICSAVLPLKELAAHVMKTFGRGV